MIVFTIAEISYLVILLFMIRCNPRGNNSVFVVLSPLAVLMCFGPRMGPFAITIHYYKNTFIG